MYFCAACHICSFGIWSFHVNFLPLSPTGFWTRKETILVGVDCHWLNSAHILTTSAHVIEGHSGPLCIGTNGAFVGLALGGHSGFLLSLFVLILCWSKPKLRTIWPSKIEILIAGVCHFYILQYSPIHGYGFNPFQCVAHEFKLRAQGSVAHAKVFHYVMGMWSVARTHNNFCFKEHSLEKGLFNYEMRDTRNFCIGTLSPSCSPIQIRITVYSFHEKKRNISTTTFFTIQCNL